MRHLGLTIPLLAIVVPANAQSMDNVPGMTMPMKPAAKSKAAPKRKVPTKATPTDANAGHEMSTMPGMGMGPSAKPGASDRPPASKAGQALGMPDTGMSQSKPSEDMSGMPGMNAGQPMAGKGMASMKMGPGGATKPVIGNAPPPPAPTDHAADLIYGSDAMRSSRTGLRTEQGGQDFHMVLFNLAEYQFNGRGVGYRWDGQAWYGGDINRFVAKTEGEGTVRGGVETAEVQALYSRAIGPYWNLQGGVRYDIRPTPSRTYATIGIEGLAPNNFELNGALFVSDKADVLARAEGYYDQRITQRVILQPRVELNFAAQNVPENRIGVGLSNAELGLRLRYEMKREFAPYIGVSWDQRVGDTARYYRATGESASKVSFVLGVRTWF